MRLLLPLSFAALLIAAGCSKDKDVEPPAVLVNFPSTLPIKKLWSEGVGGGKKQIKLRLGLGPTIDNGLVFAASHKGEMVAVALDSGKNIWVKKLKVPISAWWWPVPARAPSSRWTEPPGASFGARRSIRSCSPRRRSARRRW